MSKSENTITPKPNQELITEKNLSTIEEKLVNGMTLTEILEDKQYPFSLMRFYAYLKKNPELEARILEARKLGIQTLIDKLMQVFSYQEIESPNEVLWIREKTKFVQWVAGKISDLYSDNKPTKQNIDQKMTISWEDNSDDLIDVSAEEVSTPTEE
jgi:CO dehydrogenase/acetyl-CoA synthase beta subunit